MRSISATVCICAVLVTGAGHAATVFSGSGAAAGDIQGVVDDFRAALGDLNPFVPESFADGRREINWDGVPDALSDPAPLAPDFFNQGNPGTARGIELVATGPSSAVQVSASIASGNPEFGAPDDFSTFSPEKLFRTLDGSTLDTLFFDPSDQVTEATTAGFGAIFTGLVGDEAPSLTFFGAGGGVLAREGVEIEVDGGLAFLGVVFEDADVARVAIDTGNSSVVMDDFLYGEPAPIPLPAGLPLLLAGLAGLAIMGRGGPRLG